MSHFFRYGSRTPFVFLASLAGALLANQTAGLASAPVTGVSPPAASPAGANGSLDDARRRAAAGDLSALRAYVAAKPEDRDAKRLLGDYALSKGDSAEAESIYLALLASSRDDKTTHDRLGRLYARADRIAEAIAQFEASLPDVVAYADLVSLHRRIGDLPAFVAATRDRAETLPDDAMAQFGYGVVLRGIHQPELALVYLENARRLAPRTSAVLDEVGNAELDLGRTSDAIASFDASLAFDPRDYTALVDEAVARIDAEPARARTELNRAVSIRPTRPEGYVDLGYLEWAAGRSDAATAYDSQALALDPFFRDAYVNLGFAYLANGRLQLAEETFLRGLGASHDDGRIEYLLGETLAKQGKADLARSAYRTATLSDEPDVAAAARQELSAGH